MKRQTIADVAEEILKRAKQPLHYRKITTSVLRELRLKGNTPWETVRSKVGTNAKFKRVSEGFYALTEWTRYKRARFAKDIAYDILKSTGKGMSPEALGKEILKERQFVGTPALIVRNATRNDKRFRFDPATKLISLTKGN